MIETFREFFTRNNVLIDCVSIFPNVVFRCFYLIFFYKDIVEILNCMRPHYQINAKINKLFIQIKKKIVTICLLFMIRFQGHCYFFFPHHLSTGRNILLEKYVEYTHKNILFQIEILSVSHSFCLVHKQTNK